MAGPSAVAQTLTGSFEYDGYVRDYRLYVPEAYDGTEAWPLVFNLHGYTSNAAQQELYAQMNGVADQGSFLVCYPNGINNAWNVGFGGLETDDVGFINALLDTLMVYYQVDPGRVYSCGMSNGGFMSYKLACESADRFAAVASVTGSMVPAEAAACAPSRPVPVLEIHGTADLVVPYAGLFNSLSIPDLLAFWVGQNGCTGDPLLTPVPNSDPFDGSTAELVQYLDCEAGSEVWHYKVINGGHTWPGAGLIIGITNQDFDASEAIWAFFQRHSLAGPSSAEDAPLARGMEVFPNPFSRELIIRLPDGGLRMASVWDARGRLVWRGSVSGATVLPAVSWPAGIYWLQVEGLGSRALIRQ